MKMRQATKIVTRISVRSNLPQLPLHTIRKASLMVKTPVLIGSDLLYCPRELDGQTFYKFSDYRGIHDGYSYYEVIVRHKLENLPRNVYCLEFQAKAGLTLDLCAGSCIDNAIDRAISIASKLKACVHFDFNGAIVVARPFSRYEQLRRAWDDELERKHQAYLASPEYAEYKAKRAAEVLEKQTKVDSLLQNLPNVVKSNDDIIQWIGEFVLPADDTDVQFDADQLANFLEENGWIDSDMVLTEEEKQSGITRIVDRTTMAKYIVGQVISCLRNGLGPHPVCLKFIEEYQEMAA